LGGSEYCRSDKVGRSIKVEADLEVHQKNCVGEKNSNYLLRKTKPKLKAIFALLYRCLTKSACERWLLR